MKTINKDIENDTQLPSFIIPAANAECPPPKVKADPIPTEIISISSTSDATVDEVISIHSTSESESESDSSMDSDSDDHISVYDGAIGSVTFSTS